MPPEVEYCLTEYGVTANTAVDVMRSWAACILTPIP
ncbi:winged helix-turn-helix transcriptional regulator [Paenibacillus sp. S150]|nr:winged helix-turn-helix transcriptional regulator [Paenibacillus sp. S150]